MSHHGDQILMQAAACRFDTVCTKIKAQQPLKPPPLPRLAPLLRFAKNLCVTKRLRRGDLKRGAAGKRDKLLSLYEPTQSKHFHWLTTGFPPSAPPSRPLPTLPHHQADFMFNGGL